jgi:hypothetical protein
MFGIDELKDELEEILGNIFIIHDNLDIISNLDITCINNNSLKTANNLLINGNENENDIINKFSFILEIIQLAEFYCCFNLIRKAIHYLRLSYLLKDIQLVDNNDNFDNNLSIKDNINTLLSNLSISDELRNKLKTVLLNYSSNIVFSCL